MTASASDHPVAQDAVVVNNGVGVQDALAPEPCAGADVGARVKHAPLAERRGAVHVGGRVNALVRVLAEAVQLHHRLAVREVRIAAPQQQQPGVAQALGPADVGRADHRRRTRALELARVLGVGQEAHLLRPRFFQRLHAAHGHVFQRGRVHPLVHLRPDGGGQTLQCHCQGASLLGGPSGGDSTVSRRARRWRHPRGL
jgi:hypothetical protein